MSQRWSILSGHNYSDLVGNSALFEYITQSTNAIPICIVYKSKYTYHLIDWWHHRTNRAIFAPCPFIVDGSQISELYDKLQFIIAINENLFICHIMNLLWSLSDKGTRVRFCWSLWHWRKWKSGSTSKRDHRPRYRPTGKCPLYRYKTTGQLLHSEVGSNQVGCSCTWQRSLSCETNTGATEEVPAPNQGWGGCNHPTSNWPYQGHQIPYLVARTTNWLSPLWWNTDH